MRQSQLFGKTERIAPKEAVLPSHQLLHRAGFIREVSSGRFILAPLGMRVIQKIILIIDEEMEKIGSQRVILPTLHPLEIWQKTHRDQAFGQSLMRVTDRRGAEFVIGATAEGLMVELVKMFRPTHKDLPVVLHQFSQKFRDELRARGGLIRLREFTMKDAYSFAADEESFMKTYWDQFHAYERIAQRLGLVVVPVEADSGALGGDFCHEFMVLNDQGEDRILVCDACDYKANWEKAVLFKEDKNLDEAASALQEIEAVRGTTMTDGVNFHNLPLWRQIKDVLFVDEKGRFVLAASRGDLDVNEMKLAKLSGSSEFRHATDDEIRVKVGSEPGFISPVKIRDRLAEGAKLVLVADESLKNLKNAYGGANQKNRDLLNMNFGRDYDPNLIGDITSAFDGAVCGKCRRGKLSEKRAIEFGHVFKYDDFYTKAHGGTFVDKDNREKYLQMGAFGIGLERAMALVVESHHDEKGIVWPEALAPFQIHLIEIQNSNIKIQNDNSKSKIDAGDIYKKLTERGIEVLWDDREEVSPGEKFAEADLIGLPYRVVVSEKSLSEGGLELKKRDQKEAKIVNLEQLLNLSQK